MAYSSYNYGSNMLSGAGQGAAAGATASGGNPFATTAGGVLGMVSGFFQSAAEEADMKRRIKILQQAANNLGVDYNNIAALYEEFAKNYTPGGWTYDENGNKISSADLAMQEAAKKINDWDQNTANRFKEAGILDANGKINSSAMKFNLGENEDEVMDFVNPYMGNVIDASNAKVQHSAAGAGLGRSTGAAKAIAENTAKEYNELYNTGLNAFQQNRVQAYNEWSGYLDNINKTLDSILKSDQYGIGQQKNLGDEFLKFQSDLVDSQAGIKRDSAQGRAQIALAQAQL